jgi:hypothetical protein
MNENKEKVPKEQVKADIKAILEGQYPEETIVTLGENRGQLFARIPKIVTKRLKLDKGSRLLFKVFNNKDKKPKLEVEVVNG